MVTNRSSADGNLHEAAANIVENLASRVAQAAGGTITVNHLLPFLPMSFGLVKQTLDNMVDGAAVISQTEEGRDSYTFVKYAGEAGGAAHPIRNCVGCDCELPKRRAHEAIWRRKPPAPDH
jgi:hypothetical protein